MNLEDTLTRTLHDHLDAVATPRVDLESVRRAGERRRAATTAAGLLGAVALVAGGVALATTTGDDDRVVQPAGLPAMDFDEGVRAFYDDGRAELHLGGVVVPRGRVAELDLTAAATPWGVVYVTPQQEVRLVAEDGSIRRLAAAPEDPGQFSPRVKYDAVEPLVAWLTRDGGDVLLTVHRLGDDAGVVGTTSVPCGSEKACAWQQVAGIDSGKVFVREPGGATQVFEVADLAAEPVRLDDFTVADVRNQVVLGTGTPPEPAVLGEGWRSARAQGPESLLTFDGRHQVHWSSTLRSTEGGEPVRLDVPAGDGVEFVSLDSDGSVMVAVMSGSGNVYHDCDTTTAVCEEFARLGPGTGDPVFLGADM